MHLYFYSYERNFGDALNKIIWPKVITADLSGAENEYHYFVGIGTLLNDRLPTDRLLHVFGSGAGYGSSVPKKLSNWELSFVRGPLTAKAIGVDISYGISDPAILLNTIIVGEVKKQHRCSFMPHIEMDSERYRSLCESIGLNYISPRDNCDHVITSISSSERIICSAMHGAIVAESLRVPWLPVQTSEGILTFKWHDWAASLELNFQMTSVPAIWPKVENGVGRKIAAVAKTEWTKRRLSQLAKSGDFVLGSDKILKDRIELIMEKVYKFNDKWG